MRQLIFNALFLIISINFLTAQNSDSLDVSINFYQKIELSDGIHLAANIYKPIGTNEKYPTILIITPYVSDENHSRGLFFARNGYVFISVDSRGRGNSEGQFIPFENDGKDGYDIIDWIAKQDWSNGNIGMLGGSYRGMNQWLTLKFMPKNLKTIVPIASVGPGIDFPKHNNIFYPYMMRWLMFVSGKTRNTNLFQDNFWKNKEEQLYKNDIPFYKYDSVVGFSSQIFKKWVAHPTQDEYWESFHLTPEENNKINIPILSITGYFDGDQPGALSYYNNHMKYGSPAITKNHFLIIGPWDHGGTRKPKSELGGLKFGKNAVIDMNGLYLQWFDWTLQKKGKPEFLKNRVAYYEMGTNLWKYATNLESISNDKKNLYLNSLHSSARNIFLSGELVENPIAEDSLPDSIIYNPLFKKGINNPSYQDGSDDDFTNQNYINDNGILIYHSKPLDEDITLNGKISLEVYMSMNVEDTDLTFTLYEITKDNKSIFLQTDMMRARYRNGLKKPQPVLKNKIDKYVFKGEFLLSRVVKKGSRLRLVFSIVDSPRVQKNYNTFKDVSYQSKTDSKEAHIKLYHNLKYPSHLILPIYK